MELKNIYLDKVSDLEKFSDGRGSIVDVFYKKNINHVNIVESKPLVVRGNHTHRLTVQHVLILDGSLTYWYQEKDNLKPSFIELNKGDLVTSPPGEIHAMKIGPSGCTFMAFSEGPRGGEDYESDTFRVNSIIENE